MSVKETHQAIVTIYRRGKTPISLQVDSLNDKYRDFLNISITRTLRGPAAVSITMQGRKYKTGDLWSSIIGLGDMVKIDAAVYRNPDAASMPWKTIFFGFIQSCTFQSQVEQSGFQEITTINASCALGILQGNSYNYWLQIPLPERGLTLPERIVAKINKTGDFADAVAGTSVDNFGVVTSMAEALKLVFTTLIYGNFPLRKTINLDNGTSKDYLWEDLHAFNFQSDLGRVSIPLNALAPEAQSWADTIQAVVDAPEFFEFYCEMLPSESLQTAIDTPRTKAKFNKEAALNFPSKFLNASGEAINYTETFVLRPNPFPIYDPDTYGSTPDFRLWDALPTYKMLEGVGYENLEISRNNAVNNVYSMFSVKPVNFLIKENDAAYQQLQSENIIIDFDKYINLTGRRHLDVNTRRLPIEFFDETGKFTTKEKQQSGNLYQVFTKRLNYELFSYNHFNDLYYSGQVTGPFDTRIELGCRFVLDWNVQTNTAVEHSQFMLFYVEGYIHEITANSAKTSLAVTRGLPLDMYEKEYFETLGRKRFDAEIEPVVGVTAAAALITARGL